MDILYLVGNSSVNDFADLRFSLRSIEKYGKNVGRVFVCGFCPDFLSDEVIKLPVEILPTTDIGEKARNIYKQIIYAVEHSDIGVNDNGNFLISMDDHYIFKPVDYSSSYPRYVKDYVRRKCRHNLPLVFEDGFVSPIYQKFLVETAEYLQSKGLSTLNFVPHRNMVVNRNIVEELQTNGINKEIFENKINVEGILLLINYEYYKNPFEYTIVFDFKTVNPKMFKKYLDDGATFMSTGDFTLYSPIFRLLSDEFHAKSKYEK